MINPKRVQYRSYYQQSSQECLPRYARAFNQQEGKTLPGFSRPNRSFSVVEKWANEENNSSGTSLHPGMMKLYEQVLGNTDHKDALKKRAYF